MKVFLFAIGLFLGLQAQAAPYAPYVACYVVPQYSTNYLKDDSGNVVGLVYKKQTKADYSQKFVINGKTVLFQIEENNVGITAVDFQTEIESGSDRNDVFLSLSAEIAYKNVQSPLPLILLSEERYQFICKEMAQAKLP